MGNRTRHMFPISGPLQVAYHCQLNAISASPAVPTALTCMCVCVWYVSKWSCECCDRYSLYTNTVEVEFLIDRIMCRPHTRFQVWSINSPLSKDGFVGVPSAMLYTRNVGEFIKRDRMVEIKNAYPKLFLTWVHTNLFTCHFNAHQIHSPKSWNTKHCWITHELILLLAHGSGLYEYSVKEGLVLQLIYEGLHFYCTLKFAVF